MTDNNRSLTDNRFLTKLSQNLLEILDEDDEYYDITIEVGKDPYVKIFRAHMIILYYRSPYFRRVLSSEKKTDDGTLVTIKLPNISPENFHIILRYIYGGKITLERYNTSDIINILVVANELSLQELIIYLQLFLIENRTKWMEQNFHKVYQTSFKNDSLSELQKYCTELISKEPGKVFKSVDFVSIPEELLISLIQNDNLQMSDIQVWEHLLKWGIAQNPELTSNPSSYAKDDFDTLRNTLQQFIPSIRFYNLTPKEFSDKVLPFKEIIPKELYEDLIKDFLNPDSKQDNTLEGCDIGKISLKNVDSKIISDKHVETISKWVNKLDTTDKLTSSYEFKLLLRGSRDGFTTEKFHEICNNQSRTVLIIKVKDSNEILGGYNPIEWKSNVKNIYDNTKDSFIFSFKGQNNILSNVTNEVCAINNWIFSGPSFGRSDLIITFGYDCSFCKKFDYEKQIRDDDSYFSVEEYEVFQI